MEGLTQVYRMLGTWPNLALLTVSKELAPYGSREFCAYVKRNGWVNREFWLFHTERYKTLTQLAQLYGACL